MYLVTCTIQREHPLGHLIVIGSGSQGRIQGGGGPGGQDPPPSFGGPPNFKKWEKTSQHYVLVLNSYPDPQPPLSKILYHSCVNLHALNKKKLQSI